MLIITLFLSSLATLILYWKWAFQYWRRRKVPFLEPQIPFGNISTVLRGKEHYGVNLKRLYNQMKTVGWKSGGIYFFTKPQYLLTDLELVKTVLVKDFHHFTDRDFYCNPNEPLQNHLVNLRGEKWHNLRSKLTPTFTSSKMRMMFEVMTECVGVLHKRMDEEVAKKKPIDIREILSRFTTNIIGSCVLGFNCTSLENEDSRMRKLAKKVTDNDSVWKMFLLKFATAYPRPARFFHKFVFDKDIVDYFTHVANNTVDYREKNNVTRNDLMQLLIDLRNQPDLDNPLTMDELVSQCFLYFGAGFETSASLMTFALYELAKHQVIQHRLRKEIGSVLARHDNKVTYDSIQDMKFLTQVIEECLRLHPLIPSIARKCVKDYKVPGHDVVIEKGTVVAISILGIHYDEDYYPDPAKFDPERFSEENKSLRNAFAHLPFGEGPRNCIGLRFGLLEAKMGLVALLRKYTFTINERTQEPLTYKPVTFFLAIEGGLWLNAKIVNNNDM